MKINSGSRGSAPYRGGMSGFLSNIPEFDEGEIRKAQRIAQVRDMWKDLVEPIILQHTNNVYVFTKDGRREMHVYVDESIYAAELNNRRELLKWQCRERFGEEIDLFDIHISHGRSKQNHPYAEDADVQRAAKAAAPVVPLTEEERQRVEEACASIPDPVLKEKFKKAMISDLEWKKSE